MTTVSTPGVFTQECVVRCAQGTFVVTFQSRVRCRLRNGLRLGMLGEGVLRKYSHFSATSEVKKMQNSRLLTVNFFPNYSKNSNIDI